MSRAIVILHGNHELSDEACKNIIEYVSTLLQCNEMPEMYQLDSTDIAKAIIRSINIENANGFEPKPVMSEIDAAIIYICGIFKEEFSRLQNGQEFIDFATDFTTRAALLKIQQLDDKFIKAMHIVAKHDFKDLSIATRTRCHVTYQIFNLIKKVGTNV